jgi:hypothetical protein
LMLWVMTRPPGSPSRRPDVTSEALADLRQRLSPAGQAKLDVLEDDEERRKVFGGDWDSWVSQAIRDSIRRYFEGIADVSKEELVSFSEGLSDKQREDLLRLPPDAREQRLRIMYVMQHRRERLPEHVRNLKPDSLYWLRSGRGEGRWPMMYRGEGSRGEGTPSPFLPPPDRPGPRRPGPGPGA